MENKLIANIDVIKIIQYYTDHRNRTAPIHKQKNKNTGEVREGDNESVLSVEWALRGVISRQRQIMNHKPITTAPWASANNQQVKTRLSQLLAKNIHANLCMHLRRPGTTVFCLQLFLLSDLGLSSLHVSSCSLAWGMISMWLSGGISHRWHTVKLVHKWKSAYILLSINRSHSKKDWGHFNSPPL